MPRPVPGVPRRVFGGDAPGGSWSGHASGPLRNGFVTTFQPRRKLFRNSHLYRESWVRFLHGVCASRAMRPPGPRVIGRVLGTDLPVVRPGHASGPLRNAFVTNLRAMRNSFRDSGLYREKSIRFLHGAWTAHEMRGPGPRVIGRVLGTDLPVVRPGHASGPPRNRFVTTLHATRNSFRNSHLYPEKWVRFLRRPRVAGSTGCCATGVAQPQEVCAEPALVPSPLPGHSPSRFSSYQRSKPLTIPRLRSSQ
jgi:hypothetical protein